MKSEPFEKGPKGNLTITSGGVDQWMVQLTGTSRLPTVMTGRTVWAFQAIGIIGTIVVCQDLEVRRWWLAGFEKVSKC